MKWFLVKDFTGNSVDQYIEIDFKFVISFKDRHDRECIIDQLEANDYGYVNDFRRLI